MTDKAPAAGGRGRAPMTPMQMRFLLALALLVALMACLWAAVTFNIDPRLSTGLGVMVGGTLVPAFKRAFDYFFPGRGGDDAAAHG